MSFRMGKKVIENHRTESEVPQRGQRLPAWIRGRGGDFGRSNSRRGSLPEGTSQPDDPGGVGRLLIRYCYSYAARRSIHTQIHTQYNIDRLYTNVFE